ncbi:hypothetical protein J4Q44_G00065750 [Coregonus suidteri]|uniref:Uncharacterized protein n=1 Tax=Coregonus suidteri TaxID=861788 RepID=A0AAN8MDU7_9TELE
MGHCPGSGSLTVVERRVSFLSSYSTAPVSDSVVSGSLSDPWSPDGDLWSGQSGPTRIESFGEGDLLFIDTQAVSFNRGAAPLCDGRDQPHLPGQKDVLVLVFLEEIPEQQLSSYHHMRRLLKRQTYLSWPRAGEHTGVFWQKLWRTLWSRSHERTGGRVTAGHRGCSSLQSFLQTLSLSSSLSHTHLASLRSFSTCTSIPPSLTPSIRPSILP